MKNSVLVRIAAGTAVLSVLLSLWAGYAIGYHSGLRDGRQRTQGKFIFSVPLVHRNSIVEMPGK